MPTVLGLLKNCMNLKKVQDYLKQKLIKLCVLLEPTTQVKGSSKYHLPFQQKSAIKQFSIVLFESYRSRGSTRSRKKHVELLKSKGNKCIDL